MEFTSLANRVEGIKKDALMDCFISRLQEEIKCDGKVLSLLHIGKAAALAKLLEEKHNEPN